MSGCDFFVVAVILREAKFASKLQIFNKNEAAKKIWLSVFEL
jgi:hypothetical protein